MGSILGTDEFDIVSPTARHRCDVPSELCCPGATPWRLGLAILFTRFGVKARLPIRDKNFSHLVRFILLFTDHAKTCEVLIQLLAL